MSPRAHVWLRLAALAVLAVLAAWPRTRPAAPAGTARQLVHAPTARTASATAKAPAARETVADADEQSLTN